MSGLGVQARRSMDMTAWLKCMISPGQFPHEYSVWGTLFNGSTFSLFAPKEDVDVKGEVTRKNPVQGWIRVTAGPIKDDRILVALPQPTFENGQVISVKLGDVKDLQ
jgi:hypothetical protein